MPGGTTVHPRLQGSSALADMVVPQGSPEVQGSKFVIGAIIPGSNNQATKEDVFVVVSGCLNLYAPEASAHDWEGHAQVSMHASTPSTSMSLMLCRFICITFQSGMGERRRRIWGYRVMFGGSPTGKGDLWSWLMLQPCKPSALSMHSYTIVVHRQQLIAVLLCVHRITS